MKKRNARPNHVFDSCRAQKYWGQWLIMAPGPEEGRDQVGRLLKHRDHRDSPWMEEVLEEISRR